MIRLQAVDRASGTVQAVAGALGRWALGTSRTAREFSAALDQLEGPGRHPCQPRQSQRQLRLAGRPATKEERRWRVWLLASRAAAESYRRLPVLQAHFRADWSTDPIPPWTDQAEDYLVAGLRLVHGIVERTARGALERLAGGDYTRPLDPESDPTVN